MSTNSRFPIDLAHFCSRVATRPRSRTPRFPDSNPDCHRTHAEPRSPRPHPAAHGWAAGVFFRNANLRGVWAETRRADAAAAAPGAGGDARDLRAARVPLAVPAGAARADAVRDRLPHHRDRLCGQLPAAGAGRRGASDPTCWPGARGCSAPAAFATIILERLLDLLIVLLLFALFVLTAGPGVARQPTRPNSRGSSSAAPPRSSRRWPASAFFFVLAGHPERLGAPGRCGSRRILPARLVAARGRLRRDLHAGARRHAAARPPAGVAGAVVSALAVDRGRDLADVAGLSYYVSAIRLRSW